jgi:hypothetical protein
MARTTTPQVVRIYLAELENALVGVSAEVRGEIVAGVREELNGLDATSAAARIEILGDPEFIAAEARAESGAVTSSTGSTSTRGDSAASVARATEPAEPRWFSVLASLLVAFGGIVIPVIGWIVGIAMVLMSKTWRPWEKWVGTLMPPVAALIAGLIPLGLAALLPTSAAEETPNPILPVGFDPFGIIILGPALFAVVAGVWLLWRAHRIWSVGERGTRSSFGAVAAATHGSWYPIVTVLLLILGGYLVPLLGWVLGVAMLWASDAWTGRDKWLGTLAGPTVIAAGLAAVLVVRMGSGGWTNLAGWHLVLLCGIALPFVANVLVGIRLLRRRSGERE